MQEVLFQGAACDIDAVIPGRARRFREKIVSADSLNFRCPGRKAANTPYVNKDAAPAAQRQRGQSSDSSDGESSAECTSGFVDVNSSSSRGAEAAYHKKVGMKFIDTDDDRLYEIDSVCREDLPGRRASFANLFFRYHDVDTPDVFEYTPCMEVLNSSWWCQQQTPSAKCGCKGAASRSTRCPR